MPFKGESMMEWTQAEPGETGGWGAPDEWVPRHEFDATMVYTGYHKGRSAMRFNFYAAETGKKYSMPISAFHEIVPRLRNGIVFGRWTFGKQGANYGVYPVCVVERMED